MGERFGRGKRFRLGAQSKRSAWFPTGRGRHFGCCLPAGFRNEALRPKSSQAGGKKGERFGLAIEKEALRSRGLLPSPPGPWVFNGALSSCGLSPLRRFPGGQGTGPENLPAQSEALQFAQIFAWQKMNLEKEALPAAGGFLSVPIFIFKRSASLRFRRPGPAAKLFQGEALRLNQPARKVSIFQRVGLGIGAGRRGSASVWKPGFFPSPALCVEKLDPPWGFQRRASDRPFS